MNAPAIEEEGFLWTDALCTIDDLHRLVGIYKSMNWLGIDGDSFSNLTARSLPRLMDDRTPALYLSANPWEAAAYSARCLAGGETLSSVIRVLDELRKYRASSKVRQQHMIEQINDYRDGQGSNVLLVNLEWLDKQLQWINAFREQCMAYLKRYRYGVVYAVQFSEADIEKMTDGGRSGICFHGTIPPDRIVAKAKITGFKSGTQLPFIFDQYEKYFWRVERPDSLLGRLHEKVTHDLLSATIPSRADSYIEACPDPEAAIIVQECDFFRWVKTSGVPA